MKKVTFVKDLINRFIKHPLFAGSFIMVVGSNLTNFIAYIYHLILGRMLGPAQYGVLVATISLIGMFSITFGFLGLVIIKFVSASGAEQLDKILSWFNRKSLLLGAFLLLLSFIATPFLSGFLKISPAIIVLVAPIVFVSLLTYVYKSFLQGLLKFKETVIASNVEFLLRLLIGVSFVYLGFSVFGAIVGVLMAAVIGLFLSLYFLRGHKMFLKKVELPDRKRIIAYAFPIFLVSLANNSLITTDLLLVKHFFDARSAGLYAAMSNLGKIIFYGAVPVSAVMFPLISKRHSQGQRFKKIFVYSLLLTAAIASGVLFIYWLFPDIVISILYGDKYLEVDKYLLPFGIVMTLFTISSLLVSYFLSKEQTLVAYFVLIAAILQIAGIWFYHGSILSIIYVSLVVVSILLGFLLIYFAYESRTRK